MLFGSDRDALLHDLQGRFPGVMLVDGGDKVEALAARVVAYVEAPGGSPDVPIDMRGTEFQRRVWQALREIPAGSTRAIRMSPGELDSRRRPGPWRRLARPTIWLC